MARQGCEKHGHINCSACADEAELTRLRADVARLTQERDEATAALTQSNRREIRHLYAGHGIEDVVCGQEGGYMVTDRSHVTCAACLAALAPERG